MDISVQRVKGYLTIPLIDSVIHDSLKPVQPLILRTKNRLLKQSSSMEDLVYTWNWRCHPRSRCHERHRKDSRTEGERGLARLSRSRVSRAEPADLSVSSVRNSLDAGSR